MRMLIDFDAVDTRILGQLGQAFCKQVHVLSVLAAGPSALHDVFGKRVRVLWAEELGVVRESNVDQSANPATTCQLGRDENGSIAPEPTWPLKPRGESPVDASHLPLSPRRPHATFSAPILQTMAATTKKHSAVRGITHGAASLGTPPFPPLTDGTWTGS